MGNTDSKDASIIYDDDPRGEEALVQAGFFLRSSPAVAFRGARPWRPCGSQLPIKNYFQVEHAAQGPRLLTMIQHHKKAGVKIESNSTRDIIFGIITALNHPFIMPVVEAHFDFEKCVVYIQRRFTPKGSIRDLIYEVKEPRDSYGAKYQRGSPLPLDLISRYGRQILEGIIFLQDKKVPYPHLHTANVLIDGSSVKLSDFENVFWGVRPRFSSLVKSFVEKGWEVEVVCFGHVLYEMACGFELGCPRLDFLPSTVPKIIKDVLFMIFKRDAPVTARQLMATSLFADVRLTVEVTVFAGAAWTADEKKSLKRASKRALVAAELAGGPTWKNNYITESGDNRESATNMPSAKLAASSNPVPVVKKEKKKHSERRAGVGGVAAALNKTTIAPLASGNKEKESIRSPLSPVADRSRDNDKRSPPPSNAPRIGGPPPPPPPPPGPPPSIKVALPAAPQRGRGDLLASIRSLGAGGGPKLKKVVEKKVKPVIDFRSQMEAALKSRSLAKQGGGSKAAPKDDDDGWGE